VLILLMLIVTVLDITRFFRWRKSVEWAS
jgi:hypothetical protein